MFISTPVLYAEKDFTGLWTLLQGASGSLCAYIDHTTPYLAKLGPQDQEEVDIKETLL